MTIDLAILHLNHIEYIISLLHYRKENFRSTSSEEEEILSSHLYPVTSKNTCFTNNLLNIIFY